MPLLRLTQYICQLQPPCYSFLDLRQISDSLELIPVPIWPLRANGKHASMASAEGDRATLRQQLEAHEWDRGTEKATQQFLSIARAVRPLKSQMMMNERDQPVGKSPPGCHQPVTPLSILIPLLKGFSFQIIHILMHPDPRHTSKIHADRVDDLVSEIELLHTVITVTERNIPVPLSIGT